MNELYKKYIDIVFCIDGSKSMSCCIETLKEKILEFINKLEDYSYERSYTLYLRAKLIIFRDYKYDDNPMVQTDFFKLPLQNLSFKRALDKIKAVGGGDKAANGLEALHYAMKSDFYVNPLKSPRPRQIIFLFTDNDALPLIERKDCENYPEDMFIENELCFVWNTREIFPKYNKLQRSAKFLVIYAPKDTEYERLSLILEKTYFMETQPGVGVKEYNFDFIIRLLYSTILI